MLTERTVVFNRQLFAQLYFYRHLGIVISIIGGIVGELWGCMLRWGGADTWVGTKIVLVQPFTRTILKASEIELYRFIHVHKGSCNSGLHPNTIQLPHRLLESPRPGLRWLCKIDPPTNPHPPTIKKAKAWIELCINSCNIDKNHIILSIALLKIKKDE